MSKRKQIILTMKSEDLMPILTNCKENNLEFLELRYYLSNDDLYHMYKKYTLEIDLMQCLVMKEVKFKSRNQIFLNVMMCINDLERMMITNDPIVKTFKFTPEDEIKSGMKKIARDRKINDILKYNPESITRKRNRLAELKIKNKKMSEIKKLDKQRTQHQRDLAVCEKIIREYNAICTIIDKMPYDTFDQLCDNKLYIIPEEDCANSLINSYKRSKVASYTNYCVELFPCNKGNKEDVYRPIIDAIYRTKKDLLIAKAMIEALTLQIDKIADEINKKDEL